MSGREFENKSFLLSSIMLKYICYGCWHRFWENHRSYSQNINLNSKLEHFCVAQPQPIWRYPSNTAFLTPWWWSQTWIFWACMSVNSRRTISEGNRFPSSFKKCFIWIHLTVLTNQLCGLLEFSAGTAVRNDVLVSSHRWDWDYWAHAWQMHWTC